MMKRLKFPRGVYIDLTDIPDDFEEQIRKSFHDYTEGTAKEYRWQDKLAYIDLIREYAHRAEAACDWVKQRILSQCEYELSEYGTLPEKDGFLDWRFAEDVFDLGRTNLHATSEYDELYTPDRYIGRTGEVVEKLIYRAVKVVMDYDE